MRLLSADLLERLSRLALGSRQRARGGPAGERRSRLRGQSQEFLDHRGYVPGDDLRYLDWHVFARLDGLFVKLFEDQQDRVVQVLIDTSGSMGGEKLDQARRVAAALSYVALARNDRVAFGALTDRLTDYAPARRGRDQVNGLFRTIEATRPGGLTDLGRAVDAWPAQRGRGMVLLFSDFLHEDGPEKPLRRLLARGNEVYAFHIVSPAEIRPPVEGDLLVVDAESGEEVAVTVDEAVLDRYAAAFTGFLDEVDTTCRRLGVGYARISTQMPVEDVVLGDLRRLGLLT